MPDVIVAETAEMEIIVMSPVLSHTPKGALTTSHPFGMVFQHGEIVSPLLAPPSFPPSSLTAVTRRAKGW